jgi:hypothetical protein
MSCPIVHHPNPNSLTLTLTLTLPPKGNMVAPVQWYNGSDPVGWVNNLPVMLAAVQHAGGKVRILRNLPIMLSLTLNSVANPELCRHNTKGRAAVQLRVGRSIADLGCNGNEGTDPPPPPPPHFSRLGLNSNLAGSNRSL